MTGEGGEPRPDPPPPLPITQGHPVPGHAPPGGPPDSKIYLKDRQKEVLRRFIDEVLNAHDPDALDRFLTPDFADNTPEPGFGDDVGGFRAWLEALFAGFPDMRWTASLMLYEEATVVVRVVATGTHTGPFRGVAPTGRPVHMEAVHIAGLRDGRMASHYRIADELSLMEQITRPD